MIGVNKKVVKRRDRRILYLAGAVFVAVFLFTFLVQQNRAEKENVEAANLAAFDPGYIISDYQMGNYNSMSEAEIQTFLKSKNACNDTNLGRYTAGSKVSYFSEMSPPRTWHIKDGHFVCMADEVFDGGTAAHIIYRAAQDYRINPQVLLVLLEKEQSLVRDTFPHSQQYRSATGYGCPDTAACSSQYYGLKNQIRNAAALFRAVLDGGWTNYPVGNNYIQYNPNAACGGSVVNIRNRATSALYRYTPYQPNATTLAGGSNGCSAYGNMNFYSLFEDWFGGITQNAEWIKMDTARYMTTSKDTRFFDLSILGYSDIALPYGKVNYYVAKTFTINGRMCLRTSDGERLNGNKCVFYDDLMETTWDFIDMETPRYLKSTSTSKIVDVNTLKEIDSVKEYEFYTQKVFLPNGDMCLRIKDYTDNQCVFYSTLREADFEEKNMEEPRYLVPVDKIVTIIDPVHNDIIGRIDSNERIFFKKKIITPDDRVCLLVSYLNVEYACVYYDDLDEVWVEMERPRSMKMVVNSYKINAISLDRNYEIILPFGMERKFVTKRFMANGEWCLQTEYDYENKTNDCILFKELNEL